MEDKGPVKPVENNMNKDILLNVPYILSSIFYDININDILRTFATLQLL